jgi:MoaA/NifB/PqqE/SkfB family radical SAM enzyme
MLEDLGYAHRYAISRFWTHKPILLTHSLTSKCNCKCKICHVWRKENNTQEMTTHEIFRMLDEARKLNFVAYLAFGGEPLMRPDVMDVLEHAHSLGLYTSMITNGTYLPDKAEEIAKVVDLTWVSLDYYSEYHDAMRGLEGAFKNAIKGITKLRNEGGKIAINCVLSKLNRNAVGKMARLAQDLHVKLAFDTMEIFPGVNEEHALSRVEYEPLFLDILKLKKLGYPILNSYEFIKHFTNPMEYSCAQPRVFIEVYENGEIRPFWCRKNNHVLGDLHKQSLSDVLHSGPFEEFAKIADACNLCNNSSTVEVSTFYSYKRFLSNCFKIPNPIVGFIADYA